MSLIIPPTRGTRFDAVLERLCAPTEQDSDNKEHLRNEHDRVDLWYDNYVLLDKILLSTEDQNIISDVRIVLDFDT